MYLQDDYTVDQLSAWISVEMASGRKFSKDISRATTLPKSRHFQSGFRIQELSLFRDRQYTGLEPMFDYYAYAGYFFRIPKTAQDIIDNEPQYVHELEDGRN